MAQSCLLLVLLIGCGDSRPDEASRVRLDEAWKAFQLRDFELALNQFEQVRRATPPADPRHVEALYGEASCWNLRREGRDPGRARKLFKEVQELAPNGPFASWAALDSVRSRHLFTGDDSVDEKQLVSDYAGVAAQYAGSPAATEAFLYQCDVQFFLAATPEELREVEKMLVQFVEKNPGNPYLSQIYTSLQRVYQQLNEAEKQLKMALLALETTEMDPANPKINFSGNYWNIAQVAQFELGDFETARTFYQRFIAEFPYDQRVFTAQRQMQEMDRLERGGALP